MKRILIVSVAFLGVIALYSGFGVIAEHSEKESVRVPLLNYIKGHETGNGEFMRKAFYSEGKLIFLRDGKYSTVEFKDFIGRMRGTPAKDEGRRKRHIESIDIFGDAAVGKIVLDYPNSKIIDYMSLLKIDGEWKIVNKTFSVRSKTRIIK
jgi:hypothetical protein